MHDISHNSGHPLKHVYGQHCYVTLFFFFGQLLRIWQIEEYYISIDIREF